MLGPVRAYRVLGVAGSGIRVEEGVEAREREKKKE